MKVICLRKNEGLRIVGVGVCNCYVDLVFFILKGEGTTAAQRQHEGMNKKRPQNRGAAERQGE